MDDTEADPNPPKSASAGSAGNHDSDSGDRRRESRETPRSTLDDEHVERSVGTSERPREIGGRKGPDPVRYGDWEKNGRCIDF